MFEYSPWSDSEEREHIELFGDYPGGEDIARRVYSSRLLGQNPALVLHGGGNTSVKTTVTDVDGAEVEVLCVKGSGWDMATIEPAGHPAVRLDALRKIGQMSEISDETLVSLQRRALLDPFAPNPSIEAVLHALIPEKFVDHSHANALISLTNQPDGDAIVRDLFPDAVMVPYVMPGFVLAVDCRNILQGRGIPKGMILLKHGLFTAAEDAQDSYQMHCEIIAACARRIENGPSRPFGDAGKLKSPQAIADVTPILRGALQSLDPEHRSWILDHRASEEIIDFCGGADLASYACRGNATPDHSIRIKRHGVVLPEPKANDLDAFSAAVGIALDDFAEQYAAYFERNCSRSPDELTMLDPVPRVAYVPGVGLFGIGRSAKDAKICADIAEATVNVITGAERVGTWEPLEEHDIFDVEYWSLEQAKLTGAKDSPFKGKVVAVTGAASGLGLAIATAFSNAGAEVAMLDRDHVRNNQEAGRIGAVAVECDVTNASSVETAFQQIATTYGGLDVLISNAGIALQGAVDGSDLSAFQSSMEVNLYGALHCARAAIGIMNDQGHGGAIVFNVSKQALNPGEGFGPYGLSKSALLSLVKQIAVEHGKDGITSNAVNADRIRTGLLDEQMIAERAKARGVDPDTYMRGNLLKREVRAEDVAEAFVHLAQASRTTGAILTVDGGNVAAMVR